ncbi:ClbS/DfsB family four-helix bundle protein [Mollicutes bacterium LVI A0039]|nr:ClbS/DfsB family four-helix bundle protein [Mollicutes bacterium LVI A0039]
MARATTKIDLVTSGNESYEKTIKLLNTLTSEQLNSEFTFDYSNDKEAHWARDKNVRDVLIHLYEWHRLILSWVVDNQNGNPHQFLKEGYNWRSYGQMNVEFWKMHQDTSFDEALELFKTSHGQVMELIDTLSNDQLFAKGAFDWVGGSTLGSYFVSVTASHYTWAMKKIRKHAKTF